MAQRKFTIDGGFQVNDDSVLVGELNMTGNILPSVDSNGISGFDLGSPTKKWRDLYLSEGSLYIDGQKVLQSEAGTIVVSADPDQSLLTKTTGAGVLTFSSPNPIAIAATLQMGDGKKITDASGESVTFGDKVDMDNNQIINLGAPTADTHAATKKYVDDILDDTVNGAPAALDTLNELANALGDDANYAAGVTTALAAKATIAYVDQQVAQAVINANGSSSSTTDALDIRTTALESQQALNISGIATNSAAAVINAAGIATNAAAIVTAQAAAEATAAADATTKADAAQAAAEATAAADATTKADQAETDANAYTDSQDALLIGDATVTGTLTNTVADRIASAKSAAIATSNLYTDGRETAITTAYQTYADQAETDAIATAQADAINRANSAEAAAEATAATDATTKVATGVATAAIDASNKADQALLDAKSYTDTAVSNLIDAAPGALDTLNELAAALGDDADFATTINSAVSSAETSSNLYTDTRETAITTAYESYADTAEADAISTAAADATTKADQAESAAKAYTDGRETAITTAYESYADTAVSNLIDAAPGALDTLNELAAAIGDDANYAASVTTAIATAEQNAKDYADANDTDTIYTHPVHPGDDINLDTGALTGATVISDLDFNVTTDGLGHVTDANGTVSTRTLTLADLGYIGSPIADNYGGWDLYVNDANKGSITSNENVNFKAGTNVTLDYSTTSDNTITISSTDTNTWRPEYSLPGSVVHDTEKEALHGTDALSISGHTITLKKGDNSTESVTVPDNNTTYSAGTGLDLSGTTFSIDSTVATKSYVDALVHFHSSVVVTTAANATANETASIQFTFSDLSSAVHYVVYINRIMLRPDEYSVSGSTLTLVTGLIDEDDEIEVTGLKR